MAWMFAGTENDMSVGMHLHYHYLPPVMPPTPFYPHPALGIARDKFASKTKVNNRKAARTGTKFKVLMPPHLPLIGPLTHGVGKENTGIQQGWMGAGIGVHPFGGIGFVVIEGKPALGFLSNLMGCWCVAPGFDMMLPFVGLDFLMIPTHAPTVLYGPAPLALDLFVLLIAMIECVLDYLVGKIKIPILKDIAGIAKNAVVEGLETAATAYESGVRPISACLAAGGKAAGYTFVDGMVGYAAGKITGPLGKIPIAGGAVQGWAKGQIHGAANDQINNVLPGYNDYLADKKKQKAAQGATPGGVFGAVDQIGTSWGKGANAAANKRYATELANRDPNAKARPGDLEVAKKDGAAISRVGLDNAVRGYARGEVANNVSGAVSPPAPKMVGKIAGQQVSGGMIKDKPLPPKPDFPQPVAPQQAS